MNDDLCFFEEQAKTSMVKLIQLRCSNTSVICVILRFSQQTSLSSWGCVLQCSSVGFLNHAAAERSTSPHLSLSSLYLFPFATKSIHTAMQRPGLGN